MADRFSTGEAIKSGFRLIQREPKAVIGWGLLYFVLAMLPQGIMWLSLMPLLTQATRTGALADAMAFQSRMTMLQPFQLIGSLVAMSLLYTAVIRAVLEPAERRHAYVRFGEAELWVGLVSLVASVLLALVVMMLALPLFFAAMLTFGPLAGRTASVGAGTIAVFVLLGLALAALIIWLGARFSMALPMSFAERKFLLFESWSMTRGHTAQIVVTLLLTMLLVLLLEFAFFGTGLAGSMTESLPSSWLAPAVVGGALLVLVWSVAIAGFYALTFAPVADIYRQIRPKAPPAA